MKLKPNRPLKTKKDTISKRSRARQLAMQGVYQWLITGYDFATIETQLHDEPGFKRADFDFFTRLLEGSLENRANLESAICSHLDRPLTEISPIERAILIVAAFELVHSLDVPFQVVINEAIELAKKFGGTDGHKYVNAVLNEQARQSRAIEIAHTN